MHHDALLVAGSGGGSGVSAADLKCGTRGFMPAATHLTLALGPAPSNIMSVEITGDPALTAMSDSPLHVCFRLYASPKNGKIFENPLKDLFWSFCGHFIYSGLGSFLLDFWRNYPYCVDILTKLSFVITWSQPQSRNVAVA